MSAPSVIVFPSPQRNIKFLQAVVGVSEYLNAHVCGFTSDPDDKGCPDANSRWAGGRWSDIGPGLSPDMNTYFSISTYTGKVRGKEFFRQCHAVVLDDIGVKAQAHEVLAVMGDPSWRIETSPGNEQWGYALSPPETNVAKVEAILDALIDKGLTDAGGQNVTRYARLPVGTNTKARCGPGGFAHVAKPERSPLREFGGDELLRRLAVPDRDWTLVTSYRRRWMSPSDLADGGLIIRTLEAWGDLTGTKTRDGGWHMTRCPWDHEHGTPGDNRAAVWPWGAFKCFHGHCVHRDRDDLLAWFNAKLADESAGLVTHLAQLEFDRVKMEAVMPPSPASSPGPTPAAREVLEEMIWVTTQAQFFSRRTRELISQAGLDGRYALDLRNVLVMLGANGRPREVTVSYWFHHHARRIAVDNVIYWPGSGDVVTRSTGSYANRWCPCLLGQDLASSGLVVGDDQVKPWLDLVWHVIGNEGAPMVSDVLDWMALVVGAPGVKPGWHLIVQGGQGIGKDMIMQPVQHAVGARNWEAVSPKTLDEVYTTWAEKRLVLVAEQRQTTTGATSGRDQYNALKAMTENTSATIWVRPIYAKRYEAKNVCALYIATNEGNAVALDADDRRFKVIASDAVAWPEERYRGLVDWLGGESGNGTELVAAWLRQRWDTMPLDRRHALSGRAANSASKEAMVDAADPGRAWVKEQIADGVWPDLMTRQELDEVCRIAVRSGVLRYPITEHRRGALIRELGGDKVYGGNSVRLLDGRKVKLWVVRNVGQFAGASEAELAKAYERVNGGVGGASGFAPHAPDGKPNDQTSGAT